MRFVLDKGLQFAIFREGIDLSLGDDTLIDFNLELMLGELFLDW